MSCANNVLPVYMWPSSGKIPEALCLPPVQVDTVHFSSEATETNGFSRLSSSLNRTAVNIDINFRGKEIGSASRAKNDHAEREVLEIVRACRIRTTGRWP